MKKITAIFMALLMIFAFTACTAGETATSEPAAESAATQDTAEDTADTEETAMAEDIAWPEKPIQILVGYNAGGGVDTAARLFAKHLEPELDTTIVVTNISGGGGTIASRQAKDSDADGYTMFFTHEALQTSKLAGTVDYDHNEFENASVNMKVYTVGLYSQKYATMDELVAAAEANPGTIKFGVDMGTSEWAVVAAMEEHFGVQFQMVDAGAVSDQIPSVLGEHIDFMKAPVGLVKDYVTEGDFNILAFTSEERVESYPDVPTLNELGLEYVTQKYYGSFFPEGTDPAIVAKFDAAVKAVSENPEFIAEANALDITVDYLALDEIDPYFDECMSRYEGDIEIMENRATQ